MGLYYVKAGANVKSLAPTGECNSPTKCRGCPSDFLCFMKAKEEKELIERKKDGYCPCREDQTHCEHWWNDDGPCCNCDFEGERSDA